MPTYRGDIDEAWQKDLDSLFGPREQRTESYRVTPGQTDLFGESRDLVERDAPVAKIEAFIHKRLESNRKSQQTHPG